MQYNRFKDVTYKRIICDHWEGKMEPNRTKFTIGSIKINYPSNCDMPTADLLNVKLLLNSLIYTPKAKFMTMYIENFQSQHTTQAMWVSWT